MSHKRPAGLAVINVAAPMTLVSPRHTALICL